MNEPNPNAEKHTSPLSDGGIYDENENNAADESPRISLTDSAPEAPRIPQRTSQLDEQMPKKYETGIITAKNYLRRMGATNVPTESVVSTDKREVILVVRGMVERFVLKDKDKLTLGRADLQARTFPDIDLSPYGALDRGVSREHASLHIEDERLYLTDLGSTNGTYVAGQRLTPFKPRPLNKGDEIIVGRLPIQVLFR